MRNMIVLLFCACLSLTSQAQELRFDFGSVSYDVYSDEQGYGYEPGVTLSELSGENGPSRFSVKLPEGNYKVTVILGDKNGTSETTIKAEQRRLMYENVKTAHGEIKKVSFNVNIRTPQLSKGNEIKLNSREFYYETLKPKTPTWDDKLTLQFYGRKPCVCGVEIEAAAEDVVTVFVIGDSTVTDQPSGGTWGQYLPRWFDSRVVVANHAESGMTIKGFRFTRRWDKIMESAKEGDYLLIQLGTNDEKKRGHDPMWDAEDRAGDWVRTHSDPETDYVWGLATMALEAKRHGMIPVIVSPMTKLDRRTATATELMTPYGVNAPRAAELADCAFIDLWTMSRQIVSALGQDALAVYSDGTHTDNYGAYLFSLCIIKGIRDNSLGLKDLVLPETPHFDPLAPAPLLKDFSCPIEVRKAPRRPSAPAAGGQTEFGPL